MYIYGKNPIKDLFKYKIELIKVVYIDKKRHQNFYQELINNSIVVKSLDEINYKKFFPNVNIQGVVAKIDEPHFLTINELIDKLKFQKNPILFILDGIFDPQNFGSIIRNIAGLNGDGIIFFDNGAPFNATVIKASAGSWVNVNICQVNSRSAVLKKLKDNNYWIVSTAANASQTLAEIKNVDRPLAIVLGSEGKGIKNHILNNSDYIIKIPLTDKVESLNVSVSSALILYELKNERG